MKMVRVVGKPTTNGSMHTNNGSMFATMPFGGVLPCCHDVAIDKVRAKHDALDFTPPVQYRNVQMYSMTSFIYSTYDYSGSC